MFDFFYEDKGNIMKNWLLLALSVSMLNVFCSTSELSNFQKYTKRAIAHYEAQEEDLSACKSQELKQSMLIHSQEYLHDVWQIEPLCENRSAQNWDMALMRAKNGLLKILLVSKICDYSFIHDVPDAIKKDIGL